MLTVKKLKVEYENFTLHIENMKLQSGVNLLIGPNGAGKTTFLEAIILLRNASEFDVSVKEQKIGKKLDCGFKEKLAFMPSTPFLYKRKTIDYHKRLWEILYPTFKEEIYYECIECFGLRPKKRIFQLSSGQRRLATLSLLISYNPSLIILDEPFAFLDITQSKNVIKLLTKHLDATNSCILISSHLINWLEQYKFFSVVLKNGKVIDKGFLDNYEQYF